MRTTIDLPDALFRDVKAASARCGISLKDFFYQASLNLLRESSEKNRMTSPPINRRANPIPARSNLELAVLLAEDEDRKAG
jgi:hypothetical protein